jgi:hypothetical protein
MRFPGSRSREEAHASGFTHRSSRTARFAPERLHFSAEGMQLRIALPGGEDFSVSRDLVERFLREFSISREQARLFTAETVASMLNDLLFSAGSGRVSITFVGDRPASVSIPGKDREQVSDRTAVARSGRRKSISG